MGIARLEEMTWVEVDRLDKDRTIVFVPISPIEEHGPHLPLGTDLFGARDIADKAAQLISANDPQIEIVLAPPIPLGCSATTADFPGTVSLRGTTLNGVVFDVCRSLADHGFRNLLIVNHHLDPVHMKAILDAVDAIENNCGVRIAELWSRVIYAGLETEESRFGRSMGLDMDNEMHADARETSFIACYYPELIKSNLAEMPSVTVDVRGSLRKGLKTFRQMGAQMGYVGSPAAYSTELGRLHLEDGARLAAELALKLIKGERLPEIDPKMKKFLNQHVQLD